MTCGLVTITYWVMRLLPNRMAFSDYGAAGVADSCGKVVWHSGVVRQFAHLSLPSPISGMDDSDARLETAWQLAHSAGFFLLEDRPSDLTILTKSSASDLVSAMDKGAEQLIVDAIREHFPLDGILGEEGTNVEPQNGIRWIIDPLDGTVNYLFGLPVWGVSIAVEIDGEVRFGVIAVPPQGEVFVGVKGKGAFACAFGVEESASTIMKKLAVRNTADLSQALVMTGFGYSPQRRTKQARLVQSLISHIADVRRGGAAVVDFCWLASGFSDAYYEYGLNPWDYAAGVLIATEAGAIVGGLDSDDYSQFMIAATPDLFNELKDKLQNMGAHEIFD